MFDEHDVVRLRERSRQPALSKGATGTVVQVFQRPAACLVEFADDQGRTLATEVIKVQKLELVWSVQRGYPIAHAAA
jgi:predicted Ser/Thr protein kinase